MNELKSLVEYLGILLDVIRFFADRGIQLMLLIPPGNVRSRQIALMRHLPQNHLLDFSYPDKYPDLYDPVKFYDFVHFNHRGGELFTRHIAEAYLLNHGRIDNLQFCN